MAQEQKTVDMNNHKPYRTKAQKAEARKTAVKCSDGTWRSNAKVSYHKHKLGKGP
jgi:hypothetical protein